MTTGSASIGSLFASSNCYLYVSMISNGTWEAKVSDLRDHPTSTSDWTRIDSGFPADTINGGTSFVVSWTQDSTGNIFAGIGEGAVGTSTCAACVVGKWTGSTWTFSPGFPNAGMELRSLAVDASDNIYMADLFNADFYESTNHGASFSLLVTSAYSAFGAAAGNNYALSIQGGKIYWGGEGAYEVSPLNMSSGTAMWAGSYSDNAQVIVGDGTLSTAPTYLLAASRDSGSGYRMSRYVVSTNTWTDLGSASGIPQYSNISNKALFNGTTTGEYLAGFNANIYKSTNAGVNWSTFSTGLPAGEQASDKQIAVSPWDDSYYTATDPTSSGQHELWVYPKSSSGGNPALTVSTAGSGSGTISGTNCANGTYTSGTNIGACTATPAGGSTFTGWSGTLGCTGTGTCSGTITASSTIIATFSSSGAALTVSKAGSGSGSISGTNCTSGTYTSGTVIGSCTATPAGGSTFAGWSGTLGCTGTGGCSGTLTTASTIIATFSASGTVAITANVPAYPFGVLPGSQRTVNANITISGNQCTIATGSCLVNWTASGTGGTSATFTDPTHNAVSSISGGLPVMQVNIGSTAGTATITPAPGHAGPYTFTSTGVVTVTATSVDDPTKSATYTFNVGQNSTAMLPNGQNSVIVAPAYQQAFQNQPMSLQSWVVGCVDETGTWSITSQPGGGNGTLSDTTYRDTVFTASVTGRYVIKYADNCNSGSNTAIVYVSPNAMPSWATAGNSEQTEPRECYVDPALTGPDYEIGAGKAYTTISSVPAISAVVPGTIYRLWNTDLTGSNPSTFYEYFQIQQSGTATQPIIFCGKSDSAGNLPIMDGNNATAQSDLSTGAAAGYGIFTLWMAQPHYGYWQDAITPTENAGNSVMAPAYVLLTGLHVKDAGPTFNYIPPGGGAPTAWVAGASGFNLRSGIYVDFDGNDIDNNSNGTFLAENSDNSGFVVNTTNVTIRGNHIHNSGVAGSPTYHQLYVQCFYCLLEGNLIDNYNPTASGSMLKWRGIEGIIRYNNIQTGAQRVVDMVEVQDAAGYVAFEYYLGSIALYANGDSLGPNLTWYQESKQKDFVYGNMLWGASSLDQVHYAEDNIGDMTDRNGFLYFWNNTLDNAAVAFAIGENNDGYNPYLTSHVNAMNSIFWSTRVSNGSNLNATIQMGDYESLILTAQTNLLTTLPFSYSYIANPIPIAGTISYSSGTAYGWPIGCDLTCLWPLTDPMNTHIYGLTNPNFLNTATQPYNGTTMIPQSGSAAIGASSALTGLSAQLPVRYAFNTSNSQLKARTRTGFGGDVGAQDGSGSVSYSLTAATAGTGSGTNSGSNCPGSGLASGTVFSCTATASTGSSFTSFSSSPSCGGSASGNVYSGTMPASNCTVTASFSLNSYTLTTTTSGTGTGSNSGCSGSQNYGASFTCTATASGGSVFVAWTSSPSCGGTPSGTTYSGTMPNNACTVNAQFNLASTFNLTANTGGTGSGTNSGSNCPATGIAAGTAFSCTATASAGSTFTLFSSSPSCGGSASGNVYSGTMPSINCVVTASFSINSYTVTTSTAGTGTGTVGGCSGSHVYATSVSCLATAAGTSTFASWSGTCPFTATGTTFAGNMPANNCTAIATFTINSYTLSTTTSGTGSGSISGCAGSHNYGASYTCTANPAGGSTFTAWTSSPSCGGTPSGSTYSGTMPANVCTVNAQFTLTVSPTYSCSTTTIGTGSGTLSGTNCPGSGLSTGASYSATATASTGSTFTSITACPGTITGNVCAGTIASSNITITASFSLNSYALTTSTAGTGTGTLNGCGGSTPYNSAVTCSYTATGGSTFGGWSGTCPFTVSGATFVGNMPANACTVIATFNSSSPPSPVTITGSVKITGTVTIQ
jgi:hypothetical protein